MAIVESWSKQGSRSPDTLKAIFQFTFNHNVCLGLQYIPSASNPADKPSRTLSKDDVTWSPVTWLVVDQLFGG